MWTTDKTPHPCNAKHLISATDNMIPVLLQAHNLGLQVASAFSITESHDLVGAYVYFRCLYPDVLLQELPSGWYLTDYITIDNQAICSCLSYETDYIDKKSLDKVIASAINSMLRYLETRDKDGLRSILLLSDS